MEIYFSKSKIVKLLILSLLITALGYRLASHGTAFTVSIGLLNILIGASAYLTSVWVLISTQPVIVIDEKGIYDRRALKSPLSWEQIESAEIVDFRNQKSIVINLKEYINAPEFTIVRRILGQTGKNKIITLNLKHTNYSEDAVKQIFSINL